eukprot:547493-Pyramimonas_sp.AAC.1
MGAGKAKGHGSSRRRKAAQGIPFARIPWLALDPSSGTPGADPGAFRAPGGGCPAPIQDKPVQSSK